MENIYEVSGRIADIAAQVEGLKAELEDIYEENGGEVTEHTEEIESRKAELEKVKETIVTEIIDKADDYAAIVANKAAAKKVLEAELKALKEEQAKAVAKIQARINRMQGGIDYFKDCFAVAMNLSGQTKIGGAKAGSKFTIWETETHPVEVDEAVLMQPYAEAIERLREELPIWLNLTPFVNKTELKKLEELPEGAALGTNKTINVR